MNARRARSPSPPVACVFALALALAAPTAGTPPGAGASPAAATRRPQPGEAAPPLGVEAVLQGGEAAALAPEALAGHAVVVEFWSTWCAPCIAALPHWNELVAEMAGEPVRFVSITTEDAEKVRPFLERKPIAGVVALDPDRSVFDAYGVRGIPHTVLIDPQGVVRAVTRPEDVDARAVRDLLAGKAPQVRAQVDIEEQLRSVLAPRQGAAEPLARAVVRPSAASEEQAMAFGPDFAVATGTPALTALALAFSTAPTRVVAEAPLPDGLFDLAFATAGGEPALFALMESAVSGAFGVEAKRERREVEVFLLRAADGGEVRLPETEGPMSYKADRDSIQGDAIRMLSLTASLERTLGRPVLDETGWKGRFAVDLAWTEDDVASLREALRSKLGLDLVPATREVELLVVRPLAREFEQPAAAPAGG
jgi:uncharacterized protein (TIGR03435 family)